MNWKIKARYYEQRFHDQIKRSLIISVIIIFTYGIFIYGLMNYNSDIVEGSELCFVRDNTWIENIDFYACETIIESDTRINTIHDSIIHKNDFWEFFS